MPKTKKEAQYENLFRCDTCQSDTDKAFTQAEMIEHLKTVHGLQSPIKGDRQLNMHLNMGSEHVSVYDWTFGDIKVTQSVTVPKK